MATNIADTFSSAGNFAAVEGPLTIRAYNPLPSVGAYPVNTIIVDTASGSIVKNTGSAWESVTHSASGVTPGTYDFGTGGSFTVDAYGLITAAVDGYIAALVNGVLGGQTLIGGTQAADNLTLQATSNATDGYIFFATSPAHKNVAIGPVGQFTEGGLYIRGDSPYNGYISGDNGPFGGTSNTGQLALYANDDINSYTSILLGSGQYTAGADNLIDFYTDTSKIFMHSNATDGATAIALHVNSDVVWNNASARLLKLTNHNVEKLAVFASGNATFAGAITTTGVDSTGSLNVGTTSASSVVIGHSGVTTTINSGSIVLADSGVNMQPVNSASSGNTFNIRGQAGTSGGSGGDLALLSGTSDTGTSGNLVLRVGSTTGAIGIIDIGPGTTPDTHIRGTTYFHGNANNIDYGITFTSIGVTHTIQGSIPGAPSTVSDNITLRTANGNSANAGDVHIDTGTTLGLGGTIYIGEHALSVALDAGISSDVTPSIHNTYSLGTDTARWHDGYFAATLTTSVLNTPTFQTNSIQRLNGVDNVVFTGGSGYTTYLGGAGNTLSIEAGTTNISGIVNIDGYQINPAGATSGQALVYDGYAFVPKSPVIFADVSDHLLDTTSPIVVATYTAPDNENYLINIYYRVITANTNLTLTLTWTDNSGAQTSTILSNVSQSVGSHIIPATYINAATSAVITVTATAGTANNIYVSCSIGNGPAGPSSEVGGGGGGGSGTVTSVNTDSTLAGGPITSSGTLGLNLAHANTWSAKQTFSSHIRVDGYDIDVSAGATTNQVLQYNGTKFVAATVAGGGGTVDEKTNSFNQQITTISPTTVATYTPGGNGNYVVFIYYRVETAITNVTLTLAWTDSAGPQSLTILPTTSTNIGSYSMSPVYVSSVASAAITATATSGTANNLYVSANIVSV